MKKLKLRTNLFSPRKFIKSKLHGIAKEKGWTDRSGDMVKRMDRFFNLMHLRKA